VILIAAALSVFGLVMLTTVSTGPETPASDPYRFVRRQAMSLAGAAALGLLCSRLDYRVLARRSWWLLGTLWALLLVALLMPEQLGAHRWIPIGDMGQLQPSEFTKIALILWTAAFAERAGLEVRSAGSHAEITFIPRWSRRCASSGSTSKAASRTNCRTRTSNGPIWW
jgi:cell division protein FtsW